MLSYSAENTLKSLSSTVMTARYFQPCNSQRLKPLFVCFIFVWTNICSKSINDVRETFEFGKCQICEEILLSRNKKIPWGRGCGFGSEHGENTQKGR